VAVAVGTAWVAADATAVRFSSQRPVLRLLEGARLTLRGIGFKPGERVRITFVGKTRAVRKKTATARGSFVVRFAGADPNRCAGFTVTAIGNRGSRASFKRLRGDCPSP